MRSLNTMGIVKFRKRLAQHLRDISANNQPVQVRDEDGNEYVVMSTEQYKMMLSGLDNKGKL